MKHFVFIGLLAAVLWSTVGCVHYGAPTSPYYTSYYSAYDYYNHCYYHPSRFYRCCGPGLGYVGDGHARNSGGGGGGGTSGSSNFGGGVLHGSGSHRGGSGSPRGGSGSPHGGSGHHSGGGGSHSSGGGHSHTSSSSSSHNK